MGSVPGAAGAVTAAAAGRLPFSAIAGTDPVVTDCWGLSVPAEARRAHCRGAAAACGLSAPPSSSSPPASSSTGSSTTPMPGMRMATLRSGGRRSEGAAQTTRAGAGGGSGRGSEAVGGAGSWGGAGGKAGPSQTEELGRQCACCRCCRASGLSRGAAAATAAACLSMTGASSGALGRGSWLAAWGRRR